MTNTPSGAVPAPEALMRWARETGLAVGSREQLRLAAMRLDVLAGLALPRGSVTDVELTAQWAAFICWVDDQIDRRGVGSVPGELERFTAPLRGVLESGREPSKAAPQTTALAWLWERTAAGMSGEWLRRFVADYTDFLDACEYEAAVRRSQMRLSVTAYIELRRRTITLLPMLNVLERTGHADLVEHPQVDVRVRELRWALADVAGWANDLSSHADDMAAGQDNLLSLIARRDHCSVADARSQVAGMIERRRAELHATAVSLRAVCFLPSPLLRELRRYVDLVERFMAATLRWLAVTGRFTPVRDELE
ncbi:terpene synthase family protein [Streptomyces wedmorensis]